MSDTVHATLCATSRAARLLRRQAGLTQHEVAAKMGMGLTNVARIEDPDPDHIPSFRAFVRYAEACGADLVIDFARPKP